MNEANLRNEISYIHAALSNIHARLEELEKNHKWIHEERENAS